MKTNTFRLTIAASVLLLASNITSAQSRENHPDGTQEDQAIFLVVEMGKTNSSIDELILQAPELFLWLAASEASVATHEAGGKLYTAPIDHRAGRSVMSVIPTPEFARRALAGTLTESDATALSSPTESGTALVVTTKAVRLENGHLQLRLASQIVSANSAETDDTWRNPRNAAHVELVPVQSNYAIVQGLEDSGASATLYKLESIDIL